MATMRNAASKRNSRPLRGDKTELANRIARALPRDGAIEPHPGLHFRRHSRPTERLYASAQPSFCVIAQARKDILLGTTGSDTTPHIT